MRPDSLIAAQYLHTHIGMMNGSPINSKLLAKNTLLNVIGQLIPLAVGVGTIPYVVRGLGNSGFGVLSIAWICLGYFSLFDFGLSRATTKYLSERLRDHDAEGARRIVWTSIIMQVPMGLLGGAVLALLVPVLVTTILKMPPHLMGVARDSLFVLSAALPVVILNNGFRSILEAAQRFDLINYVRIPGGVGTFALPAIGVWCRLSLPMIILLLVLSRFGSLAAHVLIALHILPALKKGLQFETSEFRLLLTFGGWTTITNVAGPILLYMDRFMLGSLLSVAALGYYTVPFELVGRLGFLPQSLVTAIFPVFSTIAETRKDIMELLSARALKYLLLTLGPLFLIIIVFAEKILTLWMGSGFALHLTVTLQILGIGSLVGSLAAIPGCLMSGQTRPDVVAKLYLIEIPFNAMLLLVLIRHAGISGAAISFALRAVFEAVALLILSAGVLKLSIKNLVGERIQWCFMALAMLGAMLVASRYICGSITGDAALAALALCGFSGIVWRYVLNSNERASLLDLIID
ncbi:MAG TPA: flippase [Terriglobia bacterium]|nr:flippase [Terriglobia bacterium]